MVDFDEEWRKRIFFSADTAARQAGDHIRRKFAGLAEADIQIKGVNDFVTSVDHQAERCITQKLTLDFPQIGVIAEESTFPESERELKWVIDPLDGTTNFIKQIPWCGVSIALLNGAQTIFGIVFDPFRDECFHAWSGRGAYLNDLPIRVSEKETLTGAFGATGFPFKAPGMRAAYSTAFAEMIEIVGDMRRCGSAALDLAYTACGRYDFFWEAHLLPWDFLAGQLIVQEAGGKAMDFFGKPLGLESRTVLAANDRIADSLQMRLADSFAGLTS